MSADLESLAGAMLSAATSAGADGADALVVDGTSVSISVLGGALESAERSEAIELGLRVLVGQRQALVSVSDTSADAIATMAERAVAMAKEAPEDPHIGLAAPDELAQDPDVAGLELFDPAEEPSPEQLQDHAVRAEAAALDVAGVSQVQSATAAYGRRRIHLAATNGFAQGYARTDTAISCVAITGSGTEMERDYAGEQRIFAADLPTPEEVGTLAGQRTAERSGARKPPTGAFPVLYDERVSSSLIGHLLQAANGASIVRGASWLRDAQGEAVLPAALSLIEEPDRPRKTGSKPFDAEGLATRSRTIVEDGVLTGWTLDLATGRKLGLPSTANAARGPASTPAPSNHNIRLTQGTQSRDDLLREMGTGLLITSMIGSSVNPNTGDYSRGASGFWVENGEIQYPVNECTVAGHLREMLMSLVPANDARAHLSRMVPSLLVEGLTIAGE
ncbi:MAG: metallopeptidase TldD-related protein [Pseudomonadota bacterium]